MVAVATDRGEGWCGGRGDGGRERRAAGAGGVVECGMVAVGVPAGDCAHTRARLCRSTYLPTDMRRVVRRAYNGGGGVVPREARAAADNYLGGCVVSPGRVSVV